MKILLVATIAALAAPAFAQEPTKPAAPPAAQADVFAKIDADASGALSLSELKLVDVSVTQADFDKYDVDKNKSISKAEFDKWQTAMKPAKPAAPTPG